MRISDWSSDVCSSDLNLPHPRGPHPRLFPEVQRDRPESPFGHPQRQEILVEPSFDSGIDGARREMIAVRADQDRKSVVSGKSVSVRVDLGGRRILKKTKNKTSNLNML